MLTTKKNKKEPRILGPEDDIGFEHESPKERVIRHMDYYRSLKLKTKTFQNREEFERFSPKDKKDQEDQGWGFVILDEFFEKTRYGGCWFWQMCWNNMKYSVF